MSAEQIAEIAVRDMRKFFGKTVLAPDVKILELFHIYFSNNDNDNISWQNYIITIYLIIQLINPSKGIKKWQKKTN